MKKKFFHLLLTSGLMLFASSCQKNIDKPDVQSEEQTSANISSKLKAKKKIYVSDLDGLYAAVNNPGNAGTDVILAAGTYVLNASYPNGGRLELQMDMSLRGKPGHIDAVLIDQSSLPFASFRLSPTVSVAGIRMGRGTNSLEWLSIKGGSLIANPLSVVEPDLLGTKTIVEISHVNLDCNGSRIGILLRNRLDEHANRIVFASIKHCEIFGATNAVGAGISLQNRISGSQINLGTTGNYVHGNRIGLLIFNGGLSNSIDNCSAQVVSLADRIEGNGCGIDPSGGTNASAATYANNNSVTLNMFSSTIKDNNPNPGLLPTNGALPGGVYAAAGYGTNVSNNSMILKFWNCNISNNNATDFYAYGAWSTTATIAGTNNLLKVYLFGISANATVDAVASIPAEPGGTNVVSVYQ